MKLTLNEKALLQTILRNEFDKSTATKVTCQNIIEIAKKAELPDWFIGSLVADYQFEYKQKPKR